MKNAIVLAAVVSASMVLAANSAKAATLIYGFESGTDGFFVNGGSETSVAQSTTGATNGSTSSLQIVSPTAGYSLGGVETADVPVPLTTADSFNYDLTADFSNIGYAFIFPEFFLNNGQQLVPDNYEGSYANLGGQNLMGHTLTDNLAAYQDANIGTGLYTVGQILSEDPSDAGALITDFQITIEHGGDSTGAPLNLYIDNVTVPSAAAVPEPASLGLVALGGLLLGRRRRV